MTRKMFSKKIREKATSLRIEMGTVVSRKTFFSLLLKELELWYEMLVKEGGTPVLEAWKNRAQIKGRPVKVTSFGEALTGVAIDVDSDGALILETDQGEKKRIVAGDVEYANKIPNSKHQTTNKFQ